MADAALDATRDAALDGARDGALDAATGAAAGRAAASPRARWRATPAGPIVIITILLYAVSGGLLWNLGYNYDGLSGGAATKIHPSTYAIVLVFLWTAFRRGNPMAFVLRGAWLRPGALFMVVAMAVLFAHIVSRSGPGMAGVIDTYLAPALLVVLLIDLDERGARRIEVVLHVIMTVNAVMAVMEFLSGTRFLPYRFDGAVFPTDTRSTALQGHPLTNAAVTACYIMALLNGGRVLSAAPRHACLALQFAALVTFGGRSATMVALVLTMLYLAWVAHRTLRTGRVTRLAVALTLLVAGLLPVGVAGLAASGFFDSLAARFVTDGGSANARVEMFALFNALSFGDLLIGPPIGLIENLRRVNGLEWGIENPVIDMMLYQGVLITIMMFIAVVGFLIELGRSGGRGVWLPILAFSILLNTSESIASKSTMISKLVILALCLYPAAPPRWPARRAAPD
jgi:hypothetical protein